MFNNKPSKKKKTEKIKKSRGKKLYLQINLEGQTGELHRTKFPFYYTHKKDERHSFQEKKQKQQKKNSIFLLFCFANDTSNVTERNKRKISTAKMSTFFFFKGRDKIEFSLVFLFLKFNITGGDEEHWGIIPFSFLPTEKREK